MLLVAAVSMLVVILYSLTPGLRWERVGVRMSAHVRRHLSVLAALLLFITMWSYRLESYDLLLNGSGERGAFSYADHQWLLPGLLLLSIVTAAAAITVLLSGWTGQLRTSFVAVTAVIILSIAVQELVPQVVRRVTPKSAQIARERSYLEIRQDFTRNAYDSNAVLDDSMRRSAVSAAIDSVSGNAIGQQLLRQDSLVYPGARGIVTVSDPQLAVEGQRLGDGLSRIGYAWAYQSADLLSDSIPRRARVVAERDVRSRVHRLAPLFSQGNIVEPRFHADTLYWMVDLYMASGDYPLSQHVVLGGDVRSFFRHAGTALVNGRTARVLIAADPTPDPISQAWISAFPNGTDYRAPGLARELTSVPWEPVSSAPNEVIDSTFRAEVTRLYNRMKAALAAADLKAFGVAYDSLGALIGRHR
jgi:uncharacterized membrane protein (UPF0182 family)